MSKFCYYDHSMATSSILDAARYFVNKTFPAEADLRMCEGLLHAYRVLSGHKEELAAQISPVSAPAQQPEADTIEAFGA